MSIQPPRVTISSAKACESIRNVPFFDISISYCVYIRGREPEEKGVPSRFVVRNFT